MTKLGLIVTTDEMLNIQKRCGYKSGIAPTLKKNGEIDSYTHNFFHNPSCYTLYFKDEDQLLKFQLKYR